jgi:pimeloyl-ACP methyl ester carboxylesterase
MENPQMTTSSVIRAAGYPLEEHALTTSDGYRLTMQRLPRKDATKIVFFMHGVLDTSLGWVCNGPIGSHAFTAHDSGADVWLGNCRANEGVGDKKKGGARSSYHDYLGYWAYSINELGLNDVEGMLGYIMRATEQQGRSKRDTTSNQEVHIVAHSLGAASVLIHLVFSKPESNFFQRIKQVILLAPAGFHSEAPFLALPFMRTVPPLVRVSNGLIGLFGARAGTFWRLSLTLAPRPITPRSLT